MGRKMGGRNKAGYRTKDEDGCTLEEIGQGPPPTHPVANP